MIPTKNENPSGFHQRYNVTRTDGTPIKPGVEYFVLRVDDKGSDKTHLTACRRAVLAYADAIASTNVQMAKDLYLRYNETVESPKAPLVSEPHF